MGQGKAGLLIAGLCGAFVLTSIGYGMGRKAALKSIGSSVGAVPAGAPLPTIQIEPIQPQEELAAINTSGKAAAVASAAAGTPAETPSAVSSMPMDQTARIRDIQLALKAAGFDAGSPDGRMGPRTKSAIREFQQANRLPTDGKVGPKTWAKLESYLKKTTTAAGGQSTD